MKKTYAFLCLQMLLCGTVFSQINSTATGGNWSDPGTWVGSVVPTATDDVIIADGASVVIDVPADAQSLQVGQGISGLLSFEAVNAQSLTVRGNVTINAGATVQSAPTGNQQGHTLIVEGNLLNNGTLDLSTNANTAGAQLAFTGAGNATFSGNGAVTDIYRIIVNKGTDATSVLELFPNQFSFEGATTTPGTDPGFLTILNGTFKISGSFTMQNGLFAGTNNYTVPPTGGIWFNNPNYTVAARAGTGYIEGTLIMDAGTLNVGTNIDNRLGYIDGSVITINGGAINVASRFSATTTFGVNYTQTGGVLTVNTVGSTSSTYASFDIRDIDVSTFTMSGGRIVLQNPSAGGAGPRDYQNRPAVVNITGGTVQVGNAATAAAQTFFLQGVAPALEIDNTNAGNTVQLFNDLDVVLNSHITNGSTIIFDDGTTGYQYTQLGATLQNDGTLNGAFAGSRLSFEGAGAQVYNGTGTIAGVLNSFRVNNAAGVSLLNTNVADIICNELVMQNGDIHTGANVLVLGTAVNSIGTFNYTTGTIIGKFRRWVNAITGAIDFPVGIAGTTHNARIDFTNAPVSGGTLTTEWVSAPGGSNGLPLTEGPLLITNTSSEGYWAVVAGDGFSGGTYTGTFNAFGLATITDYTQLVLVKRALNAAPWLLDGTHVTTTGSNAAAVLSRTGMTGFSEFGIGGSISSLPISIEYFKGNRQSGNHILDWKVSCTNSPTAILTLERSSDGRRFNSIHSITATALRCLEPFRYADQLPLAGINYYRLKMTDADGYTSYSSILTLLNNNKGFDITAILPNPVVKEAVLSIASAKAGSMQLVVTDAQGRRLLVRSVTLIAGSNQVQIPLTSLPAGTYQLSGYVEAEPVKTLRFVKQ